MEEALIRLCGVYGVRAGRIAGLTGVWVPGEDGKLETSARKIGAIGIHVSRGITSHGFAFNATTNLRDFELINPCGITDKTVTSLEREVPCAATLPDLETMADQAARQFGNVFKQPMVAVASVDALRAEARASTQGDAASRSFPAEDTPLEFPEEIERVHGSGSRLERA
jgi:lipoyl(octanoyl) transferase